MDNIGMEGQNLRGIYQRRLPSDPSKDYYFIHRETGKTQPLLIEYGFIDSPKDDVSQLENNLLDYAEAVVKSVSQYAGVNYSLPGSPKNVYTVKKGDSLYSIAQKYGVSVEDLKNANKLSGNLLATGQSLVIPNSGNIGDDYLIYIVKPGDSLWKIANQYGISVNDLTNFNNLGTTFLKVGQQLLIPKNEKIEEPLEEDDSLLVYVVKPGDTLWSVAKKYDVGVNELKDTNNLKNNMLSIGQQLTIPNTSLYETYIVQSGDSLWKIAQEYKINVNDLIKLNNLSGNTLKIGQKLLIP